MTPQQRFPRHQARMVWQVAEEFPDHEFGCLGKSAKVHVIVKGETSATFCEAACGRWGMAELAGDETDRVCIQCDQALVRGRGNPHASW